MKVANEMNVCVCASHQLFEEPEACLVVEGPGGIEEEEDHEAEEGQWHSVGGDGQCLGIQEPKDTEGPDHTCGTNRNKAHVTLLRCHTPEGRQKLSLCDPSKIPHL